MPLVCTPPESAAEALARHEQDYLRAQRFADRATWLTDPEAARLWTDRIRRGEGDAEDWARWLEHAAYLDPKEADRCVEWLVKNSKANRAATSVVRCLIDLPCSNQLRYRVSRGRRARELAMAPGGDRRRLEVQLRSLPPRHPKRWRQARALTLAEAIVDPARAAEVANEVWGATSADPPSECEVARRLWLAEPEAALIFLDRRAHCLALLPTLLRRVLSEPASHHLRLAEEILRRFSRLSPFIGCLALLHSLPLLSSWPVPEGRDLYQAMKRAFADLNTAGAFLAPQVRARFTEASGKLLALNVEGDNQSDV